MNLTLVKLPATKGSRQSIYMQLPTTILKNLPAYLAYVDAIRADDSELKKLISAMCGGLRDRHVVAALRARSFVDVMFTTLMVFFTHHRLVTRRMVRTTMNVLQNAAQAFIEEKLAEIFEIGFLETTEAELQLETMKTRVFSGLRANGFEEVSVAALEAVYNGWWEGIATEPGTRVNAVAAWQVAAQVETWRREASKAALRKQQRATGSSSNGMALDQVDVDAKEVEFEITSFFKLPKAERWNIIQHL
jgi:hypothetical protein